MSTARARRAPGTAALPQMDVGGRIGRLVETFGKARIDALIVTTLVNVRYLSGFSGSAGVLAVRKDGTALLVTDGRYEIQSAEEVAAAGAPVRVRIGKPVRQAADIARFVKGVRRTGLEADSVTWAGRDAWAAKLDGARPVATRGIVAALRQRKDPGEVARIEAAAAAADRAFARVRRRLTPGVTEREVALALDHEMRLAGASGPSFDTIVGSGPNGALPHAKPTDRAIGAGELVVCDFGAVVDGYASDMTRTISIGEPRNRTLRRVLRVVAESQAAGVAAVAPGGRTTAVDAACRKVIAKAGWADRFVHGTGHGVGLEIHELPWVGPRGAATLEPGTIVTVEPGVYLEGLGGARIEDTLVVTESGCRALTKAPKEIAV